MYVFINFLMEENGFILFEFVEEVYDLYVILCFMVN